MPPAHPMSHRFLSVGRQQILRVPAVKAVAEMNKRPELPVGDTHGLDRFERFAKMLIQQFYFGLETKAVTFT